MLMSNQNFAARHAPRNISQINTDLNSVTVRNVCTGRTYDYSVYWALTWRRLTIVRDVMKFTVAFNRRVVTYLDSY